jgi:hypothetical protein
MTTELTAMHCGECGVEFAMPEVLRRECKERTGKHWYCPNGHPRIYGKSYEETVVVLRQDLAEAIAARDTAERAKAALLARVRNGVCPHCRRAFGNLARHITTKHPGQKP